jgi:glucan biosynthesis protein C
LLPLAFGIALIVPPQSWVELVTQHGYTHGFLWFLTHDYFRFGTLDGVILPTWNHLWFVVYLWAYTLVLALLLTPRLSPGAGTVRPGLQRNQACCGCRSPGCSCCP